MIGVTNVNVTNFFIIHPKGLNIFSDLRAFMLRINRALAGYLKRTGITEDDKKGKQAM